MSPPSVDIRSPPASTKPSVKPNPNSASCNGDHQQTLKSSVFGESEKHNGLRAGSGRTRPRLAKVRRQLHGRSRLVSGDFNPFGSVVESIECCSNSSGTINVKCDGNNGDNLLNKGFVFRAKELNSNVDFVFGAAKENVEVDNAGCSYSAEASGFEIKLDSGKRELRGCGISNSCGDIGEINLSLGKEFQKSRSMDNESDGLRRNLGLDLGFDKEEATKIEAEVASENILLDDSNLGSSGLGFVFGASWCNSVLDLKEGKRETGESIGNLVFDDTGKAKVENATDFHKLKSSAVKSENNGTRNWKNEDAKCAFVFGNSSNKGSTVNECAAHCPGEMNSRTATFENCNGVAQTEYAVLGSTLNSGCKLTAFADSSNVDADSSINYCLPNEMMKLKIDDLKSFQVDNRNSSPNDSFFVFSSRERTSVYCNGSSEVTSCKHNGAKETDGTKCDHSDKEKGCNLPGACFGKPSSTLFTFQAGLAKSSLAGQESSGQFNDDAQLKLSVGLDSQVCDGVPETPSIAGVGKAKHVSSFNSSQDRSGMPFTDFQTAWDPACLKTSLFPELNSNAELTANIKSRKGKRPEKFRGKLKQHSVHKQRPLQHHVSENNAQENMNSPGGYSPMDFSPYEETTAEQFLTETSVASNHSNNPGGNGGVSSISHSVADIGLEDREREGLHNENKEKSREPNKEGSTYHSERCFGGDYSSEVFDFGADTTCSDFKVEQAGINSQSGSASADDRCGLNKEGNHQLQFSFNSGLEGVDWGKFSFSASPSLQNSSSKKHIPRKKNRRKLPCEPFIIAPCLHDEGGDLCVSHRTAGNKPQTNEQVKQGPVSSIVALKEACETWRLRGNQAYQNGDLSKAEDFYTHGINSVPPNGIPGCCLKPLVICYSNRAATRMSLGNLREALGDCVMAASLDPFFFKVQMRAGNCHLLLGEVENACHYFNKCLESGAGVCLDRRIAIEAADGLQKAKRVAECISCCSKLLEQRTFDEALIPITAIDEALSISPYSERLLEMKAEFLLMLRKYKEVISLCEKTIGAAEKNFPTVGADGLLVDNGETYLVAKLWRWQLISKCNFCLGKLEVALDLLEKLQQMGSTNYKQSSKIMESSVTLAATLRNLLHHKSTGNEAVRSGRYTEAVEHYTAALSCNVESRPFAAICFGNRAAAHQALGQITEAIADCSLAIALDGNYSKAISRRAALHEMIRDYGQAASDLQKLISILENQSNENASHTGTPNRTTSRTKELRQARRRLPLIEEEAKKGIPLDFYRILGVKESDTASEIKKAYRKAALRHHPDKAGQFLVRSESGDEGRLWKEIVQEIHRDADRLFKMIGEAYTVLSDTTKRTDYDLDEEIRKASKAEKGYSPHRRTSDAHSYPYERSNQRKNWQDNWKTYGYSRTRW